LSCVLIVWLSTRQETPGGQRIWLLFLIILSAPKTEIRTQETLSNHFLYEWIIFWLNCLDFLSKLIKCFSVVCRANIFS
jgi:hypothetical protein